MSEAIEPANTPPLRPGERLRVAREAQGLALSDVASRTRIPIRHLEAIEQSSYAALPSPTYAVGFAKAYARAIGEDEVAIARDVRAEQSNVARPPEYRPYEMADPSRLPPRGLAVAGAIVALVLVIGAALWFGTDLFRGGGAPVAYAPADAPAPTVTRPVPAATPAADAPVTLTATDRVWLRVYDAGGQTLLMKTMEPGEKYQVPANANGPLINVGRPDKLQVTIGDRTLPPLGSGARPIKDIGVSKAALDARFGSGSQAATTPDAAVAPPAAPAPGPSSVASPSARPSAAASSRPRETTGATARRERRAPRAADTPAPLSNGIY